MLDHILTPAEDKILWAVAPQLVSVDRPCFRVSDIDHSGAIRKSNVESRGVHDRYGVHMHGKSLPSRRKYVTALPDNSCALHERGRVRLFCAKCFLR